MKYILVLLAVAVSGCATVSEYGKMDEVLIASAPSGTKILNEDKNLLGVTPSYVKIERSPKPILYLQDSQGKKRKIELKTKYWWEGSFTPNLVFLTMAPIAWITDLVSGRAWQIVTPTPITDAKDSALANQVDTTYVIAPPFGESERISDELAQVVEKNIRKTYPKAKVIPFARTRELFFQHSYYYDRELEGEHRLRLFARLAHKHQATHVVQTTYVFDDKLKSAERVELRSKIVNIFNLKSQVVRKTYALEDVPNLRTRVWRKRWGSWFQFVPNTLSFDLGSGTPSFRLGETDIEGTYLSHDDSAGHITKLLGSLGMSHQEGPTSRRSWRFRAQFVPAFTLAYNRISYPEFPSLSEDKFRRFNVSGGYGLQLNYGSRFGNLFFTVAPAIGWSRVSWENKDTTYSEEAVHPGIISELGYNYFLARRWILKLFVRQTQENKEIWDSVFTKASGTPTNMESVSYTYGGLSFGFYIPESKHPVKDVDL